MIKASYRSNSKPAKTINVDCQMNHFCVFTGKEALSCLEIMQLKGFFSYSGTFQIEGNDLLDATNIMRDRTAASVITASSSSCVVTRSQVPFGSTPKTEKIDDPIKRYINLKGVPTQWQSSFFLTVQSVYVELCAHPLYVVLDLARAEKKFALMVIDILNKVLRTYQIYIYAPQVFPYPSQDIAFYDDIDAILNPAAPKTVEAPRPQVNVRELAMAYFFDDLTGNHPSRSEPSYRTHEKSEDIVPSAPVEPSYETRRPEIKPVREEKAPEVLRRKEESIPTEEENEENSFFRFDPKKTDIYNFIFSIIFFALAVVISFVFFSFKTEDENRIRTFFWICLAMCGVFLAMSIVPIASLISDNKGTRFRDSKLLMVSLILFPVCSFATGIVLLVLGKQAPTHTWTPDHYIPYAIAFFVYLFVLPGFSYLYKRFKKKK